MYLWLWFRSYFSGKVLGKLLWASQKTALKSATFPSLDTITPPLPTHSIRQAIQLILLFTFFQTSIASETIIKAINDQLKVFGKFKFTHFVHDLGLRCCTVSVLFIYGLTFAVLMPLMAPAMLILFVFIYCLDKYNLIFLYPIEFDSYITNRETLVKCSIFGVICF